MRDTGQPNGIAEAFSSAPNSSTVPPVPGHDNLFMAVRLFVGGGNVHQGRPVFARSRCLMALSHSIAMAAQREEAKFPKVRGR